MKIGSQLLQTSPFWIDIFTSEDMENILQCIFSILLSTIQGVSKKTEQIWNRSQRREAAQSMKFLINIDCLGTYDVQ